MRSFVPNIVVLTGLAFTSYRLWQLGYARKQFAAAREPTELARDAVRGLLSVGVSLWTGNLIFLLFIALPRVIEFS